MRVFKCVLMFSFQHKFIAADRGFKSMNRRNLLTRKGSERLSSSKLSEYFRGGEVFLLSESKSDLGDCFVFANLKWMAFLSF